LLTSGMPMQLHGTDMSTEYVSFGS
jgi:hypothetical protein